MTPVVSNGDYVSAKIGYTVTKINQATHVTMTFQGPLQLLKKNSNPSQATTRFESTGIEKLEQKRTETTEKK